MIILTGCFFVSLAAGEKDPIEKKYVVDLNNAKCPVLGGNAQKDVYTIYNGKIYHFCCVSCIPKFKRDPVKFIKSVKSAPAEEQVKHEIVGNTKCPVTGNLVNKNIMAVKDDKIYYLCCSECINKFVSEVKVNKQSQSVISNQDEVFKSTQKQVEENQVIEGGHESHGGGCH